MTLAAYVKYKGVSEQDARRVLSLQARGLELNKKLGEAGPEATGGMWYSEADGQLHVGYLRGSEAVV